MPFVSTFKFSVLPAPPLSNPRLFPLPRPSNFRKFPICPNLYSSFSSSRKTLLHSKSSEEEADVSEAEDEWMQKLPDKKKALYSHSLPCVEAWLRSLGFHQSRDDRAVWFVEKLDWHAQLSLDVTDLYIRYNSFRASLSHANWAVKSSRLFHHSHPIKQWEGSTYEFPSFKGQVQVSEEWSRQS